MITFWSHYYFDPDIFVLSLIFYRWGNYQKVKWLVESYPKASGVLSGIILLLEDFSI